MTVKISLVPTEHTVPVWPKVRRFMVESAEYTYGRYEAEDILDSVLDGNQLWIAFTDEGDVIGAVVTSIENYPRKRALAMHFCGGEDLARWKGPMLKTLQMWARDAGCDVIESSGRPGWTRIFAEDGHKPLWHTYELPIAEHGLGGNDG